ncbi:recombinase family protein [Aeoliella mucimassa]|uniref:Resolvase/invertase-type recombinase catalytic domain-containing protein n=1 Tax=Aeoliella mucimassa TaxID=2527972 RepID=A0A518ALN9_9BACT|nr:recombinase family protein [Aeoliella mucimassa]QDU55616.1 hypothetical protein Pan181_18080 [Aeoliella mucimassa]
MHLSLPKCDNNSKPFPSNLHDVESYTGWLDTSGIIGYLRTSPNQDGESRKGEYQKYAVELFARDRQLPVAAFYSGIGESGQRIGSRSTPQLMAAIEHAEKEGFPIVAFDYQRFSRHPHKLSRFPGVDFISLNPLTTPAKDLPGIRKRAANTHNPSRKGGRPRNMEAPKQLPYILSQLGKPWSSIARELGDNWSDKKVKRILERYFEWHPLE